MIELYSINIVTILKRDGYGPGSKIYFQFIFPDKLSKEQIQKKQEEAGYSLIPYEFFDFKEEKLDDTYYKYTWSCWASAD